MDIKDKLNKIKELEQQKKAAWKEAIKIYDDLKDKLYKEIEEIFDYKEKYLKIKTDDSFMYLFCDECFKTKDLSGNEIILIRGYGFVWSITPYADSTYASYDQWMEHKLYIDEKWEIEKEIQKISEISKEDFDKAFYQMIDELLSEHKKYMED